MEYKCPNCNSEIKVGKERLVACYKCMSKLLLVKINGEKQLFDVTPEED